MSIRVEEYIRPDGTNPYKTWFDSLDPQAAAKVVTATLRLELGNTSKVCARPVYSFFAIITC
jgi:putative component of toxin-antitoxin plasmid stabilization module